MKFLIFWHPWHPWGCVCSAWNENWLHLTLWYSTIRYTVLRFCSTPTFPIFNLSGFEREPLKLGKQMIPHFVALDVGSKICQVQQYSFIKGCHTTFLLKSTLCKGEVAWQPLTERQGCSLYILELHIRAFKWGTVCFSAIIPFEDISGYVQKSWFYLVKMYIFGYNR